MKAYTNKKRMEAFFRGEPLDRVPFVHVDNLAAPNGEIWSAVGRQAMGITRWSRIHRFRSDRCSLVSEPLEKNGLRGVRNTITTPSGVLYEDKYFDPHYGSEAFEKHLLTAEEDYPILMEYLRDLRVEADFDQYRLDQRELGEDGLAMAVLYRTPFQKLWVELVSIEDLAVHMADCEEMVEDLSALLAEVQRKVFRVLLQAVEQLDVSIVNIPDNITAPVIGTGNFSRYCVPYYNELAGLLEGSGVPIAVHMDGDLKPLWGPIGESRFTAIDSFSPPPDNDTGVAEALALWPDKKLMLNFPSSVHLEPPEQIYHKAMEILEEGGHSRRMWIQISENVPKDRWRVSFPPILRAIQEFGEP